MSMYTYIIYATHSGEEKVWRSKGFVYNINIGNKIEMHGETCRVIGKQVRFE